MIILSNHNESESKCLIICFALLHLVSVHLQEEVLIQDEIAKSKVRDHGECMQQLDFFSFRLFTLLYAGGESVERRCRPKNNVFSSFILSCCISYHLLLYLGAAYNITYALFSARASSCGGTSPN